MPHFPNTMYLLYMMHTFFFKVDRERIQTFLKEVANRGTETQRLNFIENIISDRRRKKWNSV